MKYIKLTESILTAGAIATGFILASHLFKSIALWSRIVIRTLAIVVGNQIRTRTTIVTGLGGTLVYILFAVATLEARYTLAVEISHLVYAGAVVLTVCVQALVDVCGAIVPLIAGLACAGVFFGWSITIATILAVRLEAENASLLGLGGVQPELCLQLYGHIFSWRIEFGIGEIGQK